MANDANKDDKLGLIYPVMVRLDVAEIITGDRRVIDYVLSPVLRYRDEAGRER
jgi:hemolysin D